MLFNTPEFIIFFIIFLTIIWSVKIQKFQYTLILVSSYFFYFYTSNYLILLLISSTLLDFFIARKIWKVENIIKKKILLISSISGNLAMLGFFKYADFMILQFNIMGEKINLTESIPLLELALPIGISFYTFQTISYTVDVFRKKIQPTESFIEFATYVAFFPQLVAGPIIRASDFLPQLRTKMNLGISVLRQIVIEKSNLKFGISLMAIGFVKKMLFADNIVSIPNDIFSQTLTSSSLEIWFGTIAFGIQIYCDFSGYSDIAIGAARILGFNIPINFNKPYFATSPSDFWRRWHISLSTWLRDYLYIPLGGNKKSKSRTYLNLGIVMLIGGLWHGASWNFVIWGILHGAYLAIHRFISDRFPRVSGFWFFKNRIGKIISIIIMQYFVFLAWIPFRIQDFNQISYAMIKYIIIDFQLHPIFIFLNSHKTSALLVISFLILQCIVFRKGEIAIKISEMNNKKWFLILLAMCLAILVFHQGNPENFIYFKF